VASQYDVVIIGAGAAGLMCAIEAGKRQRRVLLIERANKVGKKILMSGGGRCNFTNYHIHPDCFQSHNPHFVKSALSRYTQWDFIELVKQHHIPFHEKTLGQLFCDNKSKDIVNMLLAECEKYQVEIQLNQNANQIKRLGDHQFSLTLGNTKIKCHSLVIASGGLSIPTMGASPFGYKIAEQFDIKVWPTSAGLVPFTLHVEDKEYFTPLSGVSVNSVVSNSRASFSEDILFTHRGLSGPAALQISSYWKPGEPIQINLLPDDDLKENLRKAKKIDINMQVKNYLAKLLPSRVVETFLEENLASKTLQALSHDNINTIEEQFHRWQLKPNATEGYRTAEVTLGGVDANALSSKTMECNEIPGLYFIGEVVDVTGWEQLS